jgi:hypothetical protein
MLVMWCESHSEQGGAENELTTPQGQTAKNWNAKVPGLAFARLARVSSEGGKQTVWTY